MAYNPSDHKAINQPFGMGAIPLNSKSLFFDVGLQKYRYFQNVAEVNTYFANLTFRDPTFDVIVNTGGTLLNGVITGGVNDVYWFRDGVNLVKKDTDLSSYYTKSQIDAFLATINASIAAETAARISADALKADKTYVDAQDAAINVVLATKATKVYVDNQDQTLQSQIDDKANAADILSDVNLTYADLDTGTHTLYTNINFANQTVNLQTYVGGGTGAWYKNLVFSSLGVLDLSAIAPDANFEATIFGVAGVLGNYAPKDQFDLVKQKVDGAISISKQLSNNYTEFENGSYNFNGNPEPSLNRLRTKMFPIEGNKTYTVYGFGYDGPVGTTARVVVRNASNVIVLLILNAGADLSPVEFTTPDEEGLTFGSSITNVLNIDPANNAFLRSFMLIEGTTADVIPFIDYGVSVIDYTKIDYDMAGFDADFRTAIDDTMIHSRNEVDTHVGVESGRYIVSNGSPEAGNNWIRTTEFAVKPNTRYIISGFGPAGITAARVVCRKNGTGAVGQKIAAQALDLTPIEITTASDEIWMKCTISNTVGIGLIPLDNQYTNSFQVEEAEEGQTEPSQYIWKGHYILNIDQSDLSGYNTDEIVVIKSNANTVNIHYHPGESAANDIWVKLTFIHQVDAVKFIDVWRLDACYKVQRTADLQFNDVLRVVDSGMWENAIYTGSGGYTDALGGLHGCEQVNNVTLLADMLPISAVASSGSWKCQRVFIASNSYFKTSNGVGNIGLTLKSWEITKEKIRITNDITWLGALTIEQQSYLSMMSVPRDIGATIVSSTAMRNDEWIAYDISTAGFSNPLFNVKTNPEDYKIVMWGANMYAEMNIIERTPKLSNGGMWVQNTIYNKMYGPFGSAVVANGTEWTVITEHILKVK